MPTIDEVKRGNELGYKSNSFHIWRACGHCGKERWVTIYHKERLCYQCATHTEQFCEQARIKAASRPAISDKTRERMSLARRGEKHHNWKGGRAGDGKGYIKIRIPAGDSCATMVSEDGYVLEHRMVMAKHLGRCLEQGEIVHHLNAIRSDNRLANLALVKEGYHSHRTFVENLQRRIRELEGKLAAHKLL